jgi:hypothetical protein
MIKLIKDLGANKSGEIVNFSKRKEQNLVKQGLAIFVKLPEPCFKLK